MKNTLLVLATCLVACGGGTRGRGVGDDDAITNGDSHSDSDSDSDGVRTRGNEAASERASPRETVSYGPNPRLSVYVQGPDPADPGEVGGESTYRFQVVMTNTGGEAVALAPTKVWFDVWRGNEELRCPDAGKQTIETPEELGPGDAFTIEADAVCELPTPGEYEVRAYLSVATDEDDLALEQHYVGRFSVTRR